MNISDWLMVTAVFLGPVAAVQAQKWIEKSRERKGRKHWIFYTLMSTRLSRVSAEHVNALNTIDLAFYGKKVVGKRFQSKEEKEVTIAWKVYLDHLHPSHRDDDKEAVNAWTAKGEDLFIKLLHSISVALKYDFDEVELKRAIYSPRAHGDQEIANLMIRDNLVKILSGQQTIPVSFGIQGQETDDQKELAKRLKGFLDPARTVKVKIEKVDADEGSEKEKL